MRGTDLWNYELRRQCGDSRVFMLRYSTMQSVSASDFDHDDSLVLVFSRLHPTKPVPAATRAVTDAEGSYDTVMDNATSQIATRRNQRDSSKCRRLALGT